MNPIEEFLDSRFPEEPKKGRKVEIINFCEENRIGFKVLRKFEVENSYKNPFNHEWQYFGKLLDNRYLLQRHTDESYSGILRQIGIADNLKEARQRLHSEAIKGANLIAEAYGAKVVDLSNIEHDAMKQSETDTTERENGK